MIERHPALPHQPVPTRTGAHAAASSTELADLDAYGRSTEIAMLLAIAAMRLHARAALIPARAPVGPGEPACGERSCDLAQTPLDLRADKCVHGDHTVDARERARDGGTP